MEESPLVIAHQHAIQATKTLCTSGSPQGPAIHTSAASSHALAASSFSAAAKITKDPEAHRALELLVAQHERWAARLRQLSEHPQDSSPSSASSADAAEDAMAKPGDGRSGLSPKDEGRPRDPSSPPMLPLANTTGVAPYPARLQKSTSSLATNLASARGIPQSATNVTSRRRKSPPLALNSKTEQPSSSKPTTNPLSLLPPDRPLPSPKAQEESFGKFYTSLNSLITRIGSPFTASLAFAGLPVNGTAGDNQLGADILPKGWTQGRGRGRNLGLENDTAGGESFYVVPVSGGTMTYAGVVRRDNAGNTANDAPTSSGPRKARSEDGGTTLDRAVERHGELAPFVGHDKTLEELQLENATLRRTIEQLSRTMQRWQRKSRESENQLKNSIMALSKNNGQTGMEILSQVQRRSWLHVPSEDFDDDSKSEVFSEGRRVGELELIREEELENGRESEKLIRRLEAEVAMLRQQRDAIVPENEKLAKENEKLKRTVNKFKERWDTLREGARKRERSATQTSAVSAGSQSRSAADEATS